ncbi:MULTISPECIES: hypothetical protein [Aerosakkonema]|uniref:hypothetical protein n=1 Tax=Aerosakkonema TaxID=1246629 RepID=UPI0035B7050D
MKLNYWVLLISSCLTLGITPAWSQTEPETTPTQPETTPTQTETKPTPNARDLDLSPEIIQNSPVLRRWMRKIPNVLEDIKNDPSFRTRLRLGYTDFAATDDGDGATFGVEDIFIGRSGFTVSGDFQTTFNGDRQNFGGDLRYYILPLGGYINVAPVLGYRHLETDSYTTDGLQVGAKLLLVLSRGGAADISLTQSWVSPGTNEEVGLTTLSAGYAVTRNVRVSTDLQRQNAKQDKDTRVGIVLEWMP